MLQRNALLGVLVVCITIVVIIWMTRDSLCELHVKQGNTDIAVKLAYEVKR